MSVLKFLSGRECGETKNKRCIQELLEARAAEPTINQSCQLLGQARSTFLMDFSADRRKIASTHGDHSVRVTDLATGKCTHVLTGHPRTPWCLAFHPSSNEILASGCLGGEVRIWDLHGGGSEVYRSPGDHVIASVAFHPADHVLVFATSNELFFWDWCKPEPFTSCKTREDFERIRWVRFGPLGHCLYTGIANGSTIQRDDTSHIAPISNPSSDRYDTRQRMLRQRYRSLLTRFQACQNDRSHNADSRGNADRDGPRPGYRADGSMGNNADEHDIISIGPQSPAMEESTSLPQDNSGHVTLTTSRLRGARSYTSTVTQDARRAMLFEQHGLSRPIPQGPELVARLRSARQTGGLGGESSGASTGNRMLRRGTCSPPPRREVSPTRFPGTSREREDLGSQRFQALSMSHARDLSSRPRDLSSIQRPLFINTEAGSSRMGSSPRDPRDPAQPGAPESFIDAWRNSIRALHSPLASVSSSNRSVCQHSPGSGTCPRGGRTGSPGGGCNSILRTRLNAAQDSTTPLPSGSASYSSAQKPTPVVIFGREESAIWRPSPGASTSHRPGATHSHTPSNNSDTIHSAQNICSNLSDPAVAVTSAEAAVCSSSICAVNLTSVANTPCAGGVTNRNTCAATATTACILRDSNNTILPVTCATVCDTSVSSAQSPVPVASSVHATFTTLSSTCATDATSTESGVSDTVSTTAGIHVKSVSSAVASASCDPNSVTSSTSVGVPTTSGTDTDSGVVTPTPTGIPAPVPRVRDDITGVARSDSDPPQSGFRATGSNTHSRAGSLSLRPLPISGLPPVPPLRLLDSQARPPPDLSLLGFRRIPSEALLATSVLPAVNIRPSDDTVETGGESDRSRPDRPVPFDCDSRPPQQGSAAGGLQEMVSATGNLSSNSDQLQTSAADSSVLVPSSDDNIRNMTSRLAQEINVLGRMIAMRERFSVRLQALQNERNEAMASSSGSQNSSPPGRIPEITITEHQVEPPVLTGSQPDQSDAVSSSPAPGSSRPAPDAPPASDAPLESALQGLDRIWHTLQRRHLHPHYGVSILDETINRPNDALQAAINRAIAGAFMGTGEAAVASNIINLTHRIQCWDFSQCDIPDISQANRNIVVPHCKIHNDASCDISQDGSYLATFVPSHRGFPDDTILAVFSLLPASRGDCLFTKSFGPNAISVSLSPLKTHIVVGLASRRLSWVYTTSQVVGQVYRLRQPKAGEASMEAVTDIHHPCDLEIQSHISVNSVRWLPGVGQGVTYGTNKGDLHICRPGPRAVVEKEDGEDDVVGQPEEDSSIRHNIMHISRTLSAAIQTLHRAQRTAATQTDQSGVENQQEGQAE